MYQNYHFIGIGGVGMGTLASLLLDQGKKVTGSDLKESDMARALQTKGAKIAFNHAADNVGHAEVVVYSSAVQLDNPELAEARKKNLPILQRAELLSALMRGQISITVAGAHGKTTTTSLASHLLIQAGLNPTTAVGGITIGNPYHASLGDGNFFVAEADESDGSFLFYEPVYSIITNIDFEHVDYYQNWQSILGAYQKFISQTNEKGTVIYCGEDEKLTRLVRDSGRNSVSYGFKDDLDVVACNIRSEQVRTVFDCMIRSQVEGTFALNIPGQHNVLNALAVISLARCLSIDTEAIKRSFASFGGVRRRFELKGLERGIRVFDDYGHHPTEIKATLKTAKAMTNNEGRLITVFQPHRYSRTKFLMGDFVESLRLSDCLVVTDIYAASEQPIEGVTAQKLCELICSSGGQAQYASKENVAQELLSIVRSGDIVVTLGAGDIYKSGEVFVELLKKVESLKCD